MEPCWAKKKPRSAPPIMIPDSMGRRMMPKPYEHSAHMIRLPNIRRRLAAQYASALDFSDMGCCPRIVVVGGGFASYRSQFLQRSTTLVAVQRLSTMHVTGVYRLAGGERRAGRSIGRAGKVFQVRRDGIPRQERRSFSRPRWAGLRPFSAGRGSCRLSQDAFCSLMGT